MKTNQRSTATSSSSFTHTTACAVPRSSPLLSSSCTPFYPRSQQHIFHPNLGYVPPHDDIGQVPMQQSDDMEASQNYASSWSHVRGPKFYNHQYYASLAAEPYEVPWVPSSGNVWNGGAWKQWSDAVDYEYAEDENGNSITGSTAMPNVFNSIIMPRQASSASMKLKESSLSSFRESSSQPGLGYGQGPAKCERKEVENTFTGRKLDANSSPRQVSMQMSSGFSSQAGECESKTYHAENGGGQKEGNVVVKASHSSSKEHVSADPIEAKHAFPAATSHSIITIDNSNFKSSAFSHTTDIDQKEVQSRKSVLQHTSIPLSSEQSMTLPKDVDFQALEQMNGSEGLHQDKINLSLMQSEDVGLCSNGPHLLVECIHNLAKVLLSSQSKPSVNALSSSDCFALENTICMLSHRLFQCSANEAIDPDSQQELNDSTKDFVVPGGLQKDSSQFASMKQSLSLEREFQNEVLQNAPKVTASSLAGGDNQNSAHKKFMEGLEGELRRLRGEVQKLQEEVEFERMESNATVSLYKNLWSEAEEALKVSKAEIKEIKIELAGLKQDLTNVECLGGTRELSNVESCTSFKRGGLQESNMATSSSQGVAAARALTEVVSNTCGRRSKKDAEVLTSYFDPGISSNCKRTGTPFAKSGMRDLVNGNKASSSDHSTAEPCLKSTIAAPPKIEGDVARRLSLILTRQGLDLNKACTDSSVEWPSGSSSILEPSSTDAVPPNRNYLVWSEVEDSLNGFEEGEPDDGGMDAEKGIYQEEELEIICFKPGIGDNNFTCLKGEPEWEDVVVNALDDRRFTGKETG